MATEITDEFGNTLIDPNAPSDFVNLQPGDRFKTTTFGGPGFGGEDTGEYDEYGWLQDFINIFRPYIENQDVDDIDRVFRQEQAQAFQDLLERIYAGEATWRDLNKEDYDFLIDIPEFSDYFDGVYEQAQYENFLDEWRNAVNSTEEDKNQKIQDLITEYENAGIEDNSYIKTNIAGTGSSSVLPGGTGGGLSDENLKKILQRYILGDSDWGVFVDFCTTTKTDNCIDPTDIRDIWDDVIRNVYVVFKGFEIPGLPDWLPLPGIFDLPTIGEIWDTITGPFQEESNAQMQECMSQDDDGDGVANSASYCIENRSIVDIITQTVINGAEDIVTNTTQKIRDIIGDLEDLDPADAAKKVKEVLEGIFGTVIDSADPTAPGLPPWMRAIIIGGQYGDDIIKKIEDLFGSDIDGDGDIGVGPELPPVTPVVECWDGSTAEKEEDCPPDTRVTCWDGSLAKTLEDCPVDTRTGETEEDCNLLGRVHVPDGSGSTKGSCGECKDSVNTVDEIEGDFSSPCVAPDDPTQQEGDPCNTGAPLNAEGTIGPAPDYDCIPVEGTTCTDPQTGQEGTIEDGKCKVAVTPVEQCEDPNRTKNEDGSCAPTCTDGSPAPASGLCPEPVTTCANGAENFPDCNQCPGGQSTPDMHEGNDCTKPLLDQGGGDDGGDDTGGGEELWDGECTSPRPNAAGSFLAQAEYRKWNEQCAATHCPSGVPKIDEFDDCSGEYTPAPTINCDQQNRVTNEDGSCGECKPGFTPDPEGFDQCIQAPPECNDCSCAEYAAANPIECTECPEGESYCEATGQCETAENCPSGDDGGDDGGASIGGGGGGGGMLTGQPLDLSFDIAGDPTLLARTEFPITNYLAGIFTNSNGGRNV